MLHLLNLPRHVFNIALCGKNTYNKNYKHDPINNKQTNHHEVVETLHACKILSLPDSKF